MKQLATALLAFRAECPPIVRTKKNPHFKNTYAPLEAIHEIIDPLLAKHGLVVMQFPMASENRAGVSTRIMHTSGEFLEEQFLLPLAKNDPQGACSAVTYARRYGLSGALGLVTEEDDDGEAASGRAAAVAKPNSQPEPRAPKKAPAMSGANREKLKFAARERLKELTGDSGTADDVMNLIKGVAEHMGHASAIQLTDDEFGTALELVQKAEP